MSGDVNKLREEEECWVGRGAERRGDENELHGNVGGGSNLQSFAAVVKNYY